MNERFLFRGKREDNSANCGEWVQGNLTLRDVAPPLIYMRNVVCVVDPATIGQSTGLHDKNGRLIFEGDIVEVDKGRVRERFKVVWEDYTFTISPFFHTFSWYEAKMRNLVVVGNIHDNPELLKGGEKSGLY